MASLPGADLAEIDGLPVIDHTTDRLAHLIDEVYSKADSLSAPSVLGLEPCSSVIGCRYVG
ncbi:MAG TPA: hypothetical protein VMO26_27215 [Vicinamibacterales bacterium]|nr:hypothetical protein [Vicinamibacterales bacterium]